jgi:RNA polymerase sigma factor (TIGR02999 family)
MPLESPDVTQLLKDWSGGDEAAADRLMPLVHEELRRLAHQYMRREKPGHTLQTSALVNEAYVRLVDQSKIQWESRAHFFGIAARLMRQILVDQARRKNFAKRGGGAIRVSLDSANAIAQEQSANVMALDEALKTLEQTDLRKSQIVELRFFGGMSIEETAEALKISPGTVMREWTFARAWLRNEMSQT